ncbi:hypothetical protein AYO20_01614 [Fonsecaea nubica]|uniref:Srp40 C-terminal domain-containing protein n=1 Tax=Fonsecaea nubica TaxID=856822 RepID=A0A178DC01_9EURO|nr:hypothetical protein AYO20_01614 [Fonsecaea nubica]OAL39296.1 hypothetical protein AYO20_01614 [Fonsecaea nubica]
MKAPSTESSRDASKPSTQVLSLVSSFLAENGFHSAVKAFQKDLKRMKQSVEVLSVADSQDGVNLQEIVDNWIKQEALQSTQHSSDSTTSDSSEDATSGSDSESGSASSSQESDAVKSSEDTSPSESESDSGTDEDMLKTKLASKLKRAKASKRDSSPSSSSSVSSDSDADDEREIGAKAKPKAPRKKSSNTSNESGRAPTLKRKARSSSPESTSSDSDSDPDSDDRPSKRAKIEANEDEDESSSSDVSSSSSEEESGDSKDSSSEADEVESGAMSTDVFKGHVKLDSAADGLSDSSSGTVTGDVVEPDESSARQADATINRGKKQAVATKKAHEGARPTPLAQLSAQATADSHISNAYRSYDYAERAYKDLSVTRGKGFTKEKNKKKRGSYRGGAIDISGGKGFKFDD